MKALVTIGAMALAGAASAQERAEPARLVGDPGVFFGPDAYPPEAVRAAEQGRVVARLTIDAQGKVSACAVTSSSGSAALDAATCRIATTRLSFAAARDARGQSVATSYLLPIRWVLPQAGGEPIVSLAMTLVATIGTDRLVTGCEASVNGQRVPVTPTSCARYPALFDRILAASTAGIEVRVERRQVYAGEPVPPSGGGGTLVEETTTRFSIDAAGRPNSCRTSRRPRSASFVVPDPCASRTLFSVAGRDRTRFPVAATWITTLSYKRTEP